MVVTIRHLSREAYRDMSCIYDEDERLTFAKDVLKNNNYIRVAEFQADEQEDILNIAYELTNSIDAPWVESSWLQVANHAKDGCRNTSIGDLIQINGRNFMVAGNGFTEIKKG